MKIFINWIIRSQEFKDKIVYKYIQYKKAEKVNKLVLANRISFFYHSPVLGLNESIISFSLCEI